MTRTMGEPIVDEISLECAADHEWIRQNKALLDACSRHDFQEAVSAADLSALFGAMVGDLSSSIRGDRTSAEQRRAERARERAHERARASAWKCRRCGGAVPHEAMKWYTLALKHAGQGLSVPELSEDEKDVLKRALVVTCWFVKAGHIATAARLLALGLVTADDSYDGVQLFPTDAGKALAESLGLYVYPTDHGSFRYYRQPVQEGL